MSRNVWPAVSPDGRPAVVSNPYDRRADCAGCQVGRCMPHHLGVDIIFRRRPTDLADKLDGEQGTRGFFAPSGALVVACAPGFVKYAKAAANGYRVRLVHASGFDSLYLHLRDLRVKDGDPVGVGQALGEMWDDPTVRDVRHLHFEMRVRRTNMPVDPEPYLVGWPQVATAEVFA